MEPGGDALRAAEAAATRPGDRVPALGPGTLGLLVALILRAAGTEVHLMGRDAASPAFARGLGFDRGLGFGRAWTEGSVLDIPFDAVVDATNAAHLPDRALELAEPGGRVVSVGPAAGPAGSTPARSSSRTTGRHGRRRPRRLPGLAATVRRTPTARITPRPLVAATVSLDEVGPVLAGERPPGAGDGPKVRVAPRLRPLRRGGSRT
ncbi:hypothetical protein SAMN04487980_101049 [Streptomyces sp. cf124]|uniref:hypothetical protein n=1 Tax=Streptomyces sp. cf124 TaxID=1761903 RepID=UPI0008E5B72C|nr:hypothetical protein SAMN04487980_101049 [Streptomyces sp. cf124]